MVLLTISFFVTAVTIRYTYDHTEILVQDAQKIEAGIQQKQQIIQSFVRDSVKMDQLRSLNASNRQNAESIISYLTDQHHILVNTYESGKLLFWNSEQLVLDWSTTRRESSGLFQMENGWYYFIPHDEGDFVANFYIPVKSNFQKTNEFLDNYFSEDLIHTNNLDIAEYTDRLVYNIRDLDGHYLFSVKMNSSLYDSFYSDLELLMWVLGGLFTLALVHIFCSSLAKNGRAWLSVFIFGAFLSVIRLIELQFNWFATNFSTGVFDPRYYASSDLFPHLGGFLLTVIFLTWFLAYVYIVSQWLKIPQVFYSEWGRVVFIFILVFSLFVLSYFINTLFDSLVSNSSINFDVTDILNLDVYSWLGILALAVAFLGLLLAIGVAIQLTTTVVPHGRPFYRLQGSIFAVLVFVLLAAGMFSIYVVLLSVLVVVLGWYSHSGQKYLFAVAITVLLILATIASLKHAEFQQDRRREAQKIAIQRLEDVDDASALALFLDLEREIIRDSIIINNFRRPTTQTKVRVLEHLKNTYFSGYLSKYEIAADIYDTQFRPLNRTSGDKLATYRDKVISGAIRVSANFYRGSSSFGNFEYFAQFPIHMDEEFLGVLLVDLSNRSFSQYASYPGVLADSRLDFRHNELMSEYSYAFYRNGSLINQKGRYLYAVEDSVYYPLNIRQYSHLGSDGGFSHMAYKPDQRTTIVLSKPKHGSWMQFASLSFFFLVFLVFFLFVFLLTWLLVTLSTNDFSFRNLRWRYLVASNRILYSTRIQLFIVAAVVFTLIVAGAITFWSVSNQFKKQQERTILKNAWDISKAFESRLLKTNSTIGLDDYDEFQTIAEANALDLNLYDVDGRLMYTTQPRIYDLKLISDFINPRALDHLRYFARSQYVQSESIGKMQYISAYTSILNTEFEPIAFLSLPYYASQVEFEKNTGGLLNALINIYALVILILGLFAVFVANKITSPLLLVQKSLARTKIGKQNEPIFWKRDDEIGRLIKEYNLMIAELEQSAERIVQSERESAWKEMARQVAHEIRNPLTPLKLGMQHLERSWVDKDPDFETRFKRFIGSFIEQIDGLTRIATEFSDFARMPDSEFSDLDLLEILRHSAAVFNNYTNVNIEIQFADDLSSARVRGNKDQLMSTFNNLIKNAIEAATNLRRCQIQILVSGTERLIRIAIKDNGEGIAADVRKKLFEPNFTTKSSGTGLGLAFVKRAVENMGGKINYQTTVGKGTTFLIVLPRLLDETEDGN